MKNEHWFEKKPEQETLNRLAISEQDYLSALNEVLALFPIEACLEYRSNIAETDGGFSHFDMLPYPNDRLPYHPIKILMCDGYGIEQLLYLGLALRDFPKAMYPIKALDELKCENGYRGALFEIEVGAELARTGLKSSYQNGSPDFIIDELPIGIEARISEVPLTRTVTERLFRSAFVDFGHLSIKLMPEENDSCDQLVDAINDDVNRMLTSGANEHSNARYCILHKPTDKTIEKTLAISFGKHEYEKTLSQRVSGCLAEKEKNIRKSLGDKLLMKCVVALDVRSLLDFPFEPKDEYEHRMAERHKSYYDRIRLFKTEVIKACREFIAKSRLIEGVLLWERKRLKHPVSADSVYDRYSKSLVTVDQLIGVDKHNLAGELSKIAKAN